MHIFFMFFDKGLCLHREAQRIMQSLKSLLRLLDKKKQGLITFNLNMAILGDSHILPFIIHLGNT